MRMHQQECSPHVPREDHEAREAFTLTELLVVIAIIAILSALGTWGVFAMIGTRQKSSSEVSMRVINKMLQDRWAAVVADARKEPISQATHAYLFSVAGGETERARVIWVKARLVEAFPMSYKEVSSTDTNTVVNKYIPLARRKTHFNKYQQTLSPFIGVLPVPPGESSACLLMALKTLQADSVAVDEQLKPSIASTDGTNAINTLIDGWNRPIEFKRFFFDDVLAPNPAPAGSRNAKFGDATDNDGKLLTQAWYITTNRSTTFEPQFHTIGPAPVAPSTVSARAYYVVPLIKSFGRDGLPGTPDDIYSTQLRGD